MEGRYENFSQNGLARLNEITATEDDLKLIQNGKIAQL